MFTKQLLRKLRAEGGLRKTLSPVALPGSTGESGSGRGNVTSTGIGGGSSGAALATLGDGSTSELAELALPSEVARAASGLVLLLLIGALFRCWRHLGKGRANVLTPAARARQQAHGVVGDGGEEQGLLASSSSSSDPDPVRRASLQVGGGVDKDKPNMRAFMRAR